MDSSVPENKSPLNFFLLVFALSIPFWILGAMAGGLEKILPAKLPISALMTFCPLLAAAILVYKQRKIQGVKELLKLTFDFKKIKDKKLYIPIVFLIPFMAALSFWYMKLTKKGKYFFMNYFFFMNPGVLAFPWLSPLFLFRSFL